MVEPDVAIDHSLAYAQAFPERVMAAADLGSGGGLPGLVLAALVLVDARVALVERSETRADWLRRCVGRLGIGDRVQVYQGDAAAFARTGWRHQAEVVTARAFAPLAVVAEHAAPLLALGGTLVVTVRPQAEPPEVIDVLGLGGRQLWEHHGARFVSYVALARCSERFPRRIATIRRHPVIE